MKPEIFGATLSSDASNHLNYFTRGILAKFEVFRLTKYYDRVVWLDSDQICVKEFLGVLDSNIDYDFIISDGGEKSNGYSDFVANPVILNKWLSAKPNIRFTDRGICGNFYCAKSNADVYEKSLRLFRQFQKELYLGEQGILYILMQTEFKKIKLLDNHLFTPHPKEWPLDRLIAAKECDRPYFIHAYSQPKFWNGERYPLWTYFYERWLELGGSEFSERSNGLNQIKAKVKNLT